MAHNHGNGTGARWVDYVVLAARVLLAFTFINYGLAKLRGNQFGVSPVELQAPLGQLSLFKLYWYLCDQEPFKSFVGVAQVLAGLLLLWNRTAILGALLLLPIAANILIADISYLKMPSFYWRLSYYIGLIFLICWHYRERMLVAFRALTQGLSTRFQYPWWAWLLLPLAAFALEVLWTLPALLYSFATQPAQAWARLVVTGPLAMQLLRQLFTH